MLVYQVVHPAMRQGLAPIGHLVAFDHWGAFDCGVPSGRLAAFGRLLPVDHCLPSDQFARADRCVAADHLACLPSSMKSACYSFSMGIAMSICKRA